eukprot:350388-Chlamydomonas_euryale.AAC.22
MTNPCEFALFIPSSHRPAVGTGQESSLVELEVDAHVWLLGGVHKALPKEWQAGPLPWRETFQRLVVSAGKGLHAKVANVGAKVNHIVDARLLATQLHVLEDRKGLNTCKRVLDRAGSARPRCEQKPPASVQQLLVPRRLSHATIRLEQFDSSVDGGALLLAEA